MWRRSRQSHFGAALVAPFFPTSLKQARRSQLKRLIVSIALSVELVIGSASLGLADSEHPAKPPAERNIEAVVLEWFGRMQTGQIDRKQLSIQYSDQLTSDKIQAMSLYLKKYQYGASPSGARILQVRAIGDQTFYVAEVLFPRGDAASLLFGLDTQGKITGISLLGMGGD
ncbi:MAG TPA: hypothetical protein VL492_01285 [Methylovirgula sp.]|jgi:hypothetical protein|nr:hypothetical protein [Methylovirgula sp.]